MIDYGPDNVSTQQDIAETNAHEALETLREDIEILTDEIEISPYKAIEKEWLVKSLKSILKA